MNNANIIDKIEPDLRYSVLRTSLDKFETPPYELSSENLNIVIKQVEKEREIQSRILSSNEAMDVILTEESIDRAFDEVCKRYDNKDDFYEDLKRNNLDETQFKKSLSRDIKVETVLERVSSSFSEISDIDIMIYYHMHFKKMIKPEIRKARHILITVNDEIAENTREKSLAKATDISEKLRKRPKKFSDYALKYSECPTAYKGGELGNITVGVLYKELEDVLFRLQEKQLSSAIESPLGFHILYCDEIQKSKTLSIADATPSIRKLLEQRRKKICQKTWLSKIIAGESND